MGEPIRLVIAEDHPFFRDGLRRALDRCDAFQIVAETADGPAALEQIRSHKPEVAILDIGLPRMNGFAVVRKLREEGIPVAIVFLTVHDDEAMFEAALELDVRGTCSRTAPTPRWSGASARWPPASTIRARR